MDPQSDNNTAHVASVKKTRKKLFKKVNLTRKQKKLLAVVLAVLLVGVLLFGGYQYAYNRGYKAGEAAGKKSSASSKDLLGNISNPFQSITGVVDKVSGNSVIIKTTKGESKTVKFSDKTKITKKTTTLNKDALKSGTKVIIFTQGEGDAITATRIVVRD